MHADGADAHPRASAISNLLLRLLHSRGRNLTGLRTWWPQLDLESATRGRKFGSGVELAKLLRRPAGQSPRRAGFLGIPLLPCNALEAVHVGSEGFGYDDAPVLLLEIL